ncbi:hypothetical protein BDN70DRAFT_892403 [Pholiota conissans]|uniref:2'-phosphotransferase n=1 Tax=Pholiota conissans TaxID=109636 RepID=A0A9P5Z722_9AGAR|nr:hypothetical protein BDN70DRAFT_892403 [Pholiota conissans]
MTFDSGHQRTTSHAYLTGARRYNSSAPGPSSSNKTSKQTEPEEFVPPKLFPIKFNQPTVDPRLPQLSPKPLSKAKPDSEGYIHLEEDIPVEISRFDFDQDNPRKSARPPIPIMKKQTFHGDTALGLSELLQSNQVESRDAKALFGVLAGWLLRHEARNMGYGVAPDGFLRFPPFSTYTVDQLAQLAESDEKDRFEVARLPDFVEGVIQDMWWIRARRMHSIPGVSPHTKRVIRPEKLHIVEYRTRPGNWEFIRKNGIPEGPEKMIRLFQPPGADLFLERIPPNTEVLSITIDSQKALELGVTFFHTNDVRLYAVGTPSLGVIPFEACRSAVILNVSKEKLK